MALGLLTVVLPFVLLFGLSNVTLKGWLREHQPIQSADSAIPAATGADYLLIVADTLRADTALDPEVPTPNLDALRASGLWAEAGMASNNQTVPSHLTLLTGLDVERHGMRSNISGWPTSEQLAGQGCVPLAERFRAEGWRTAATVSNLLLDRVAEKNKDEGYQPFDAGFETWSSCRKIEDGWFRMGMWKSDRTWFGWIAKWIGQRTTSNKVLRELFDPDGSPRSEAARRRRPRYDRRRARVPERNARDQSAVLPVRALHGSALAVPSA